MVTYVLTSEDSPSPLTDFNTTIRVPLLSSSAKAAVLRCIDWTHWFYGSFFNNITASILSGDSTSVGGTLKMDV